MYTIKGLADLAGISTRTLRYYDQIDLLKPSSKNDVGYRLYDEAAIDLLQQIMFYKRMNVSLDSIREIIYNKDFDSKRALLNHREALLLEYENIKLLINTIDNTLLTMEGKMTMNENEKFEGFKKDLIKKNEDEFGQEARELYGNIVDESNAKIMGLDQVAYKNMEVLQSEMHQLFVEAMEADAPGGEKAQKACEMHKKWLNIFWSKYSKEAHMGLVETYVMDERFTAYYDQIKVGLAGFIKKAMEIYLK